MITPTRPPDVAATYVVRSGRKTRAMGVHGFWGDDAGAWDRAADMLVRLMVPRARELLAAQRLERERAMGIPDYVEEGI